MRMMIIQEYRNVIGNENILVITKKATTKWRMRMMMEENRTVIGY